MLLRLTKISIYVKGEITMENTLWELDEFLYFVCYNNLVMWGYLSRVILKLFRYYIEWKFEML